MRFARALGLTGALVAALAFTASALAGGESYTMRITPAGTAAAVAVAPAKADLGKASTWTGGFVDAKLITDLYCANYRPRYSDLIVTGVATAQFIGHGLYVRSQSKVLQTEAMVKLHWQRSIRSPQWFACSQQNYKKIGGSTRFVSLQRLKPPKFAPYSAAFRVVTDVTTGSGKVRVALDTLEIARGRTEITLTASAPLAQAKGLLPSEIALGKVLLSRARA